jgi:hypothetical protein
MFPRIAAILGWLRRLAASRSNLLIENLALRQQLAILMAKRPRPRMRAVDRFFWVVLRRFWPPWKEVLAVIVLNERHLHRLLAEFVAYYHDDRTHLGLSKSTPSMRAANSKPNGTAEIVGHPRIGGLHHRYEWRQAA